MAPSNTDFLKDIDLTNINHENVPLVLVALVNQTRVLCDCVQSMKTKQEEIDNCLLIFRVSRCGLNWIKDKDNIKAFLAILFIFGVLDQAVRVFSHLIFHYP